MLIEWFSSLCVSGSPSICYALILSLYLHTLASHSFLFYSERTTNIKLAMQIAWLVHLVPSLFNSVLIALQV